MTSALGGYGDWARERLDDPRPLSFRHERWEDVDAWRGRAREQTLTCLAPPETGDAPNVTVHEAHDVDGIRVERQSWQLPYGPRTGAFLLRPTDESGPLPGVLAFHDHGGDKYHGKGKIVRAPSTETEMLTAYRETGYDGHAWANRLAKRGYAVLVPDGFTFGSRRFDPAETVGTEGVPNPASDTEKRDVSAYNDWANGYESTAAKACLCAGTTLPGVALADDKAALDVLCSHPAVDDSRVGVAGHSGGGLRTAYLGALDERVRCAVVVCMLTTWRDFVDFGATRHTWLVYPSLLARHLDYPDVLAMRAPAATSVLARVDDRLFSRDAIETAAERLEAAFTKAGGADTLALRTYPGDHGFGDEMQRDAFARFDAVLRDT
ncbi:dienelactone hydrolase family protein [Halarchaeum sp. P4]|uniref:dienelactone hydrolase family protein n=1 Tax=Halarchaeum sp. P4 TaxID=3421639 RepID=UPI003EBD7408